MAKLEEITVGSTIKDIADDDTASTVAVQGYGTNMI